MVAQRKRKLRILVSVEFVEFVTIVAFSCVLFTHPARVRICENVLSRTPSRLSVIQAESPPL